MESLMCFITCSRGVNFSHLKAQHKDKIHGYRVPLLNQRTSSFRYKRLCQASQILTKRSALANDNDEKSERIETLITEIKQKFRSMNDGETSASAYDTAWVARIKSDVDPTKPQFPMCLDWIRANQLDDGYWGEPSFFLIYDRLVNTLSCVLALKIWNTGEEQIQKGLKYLSDNIKNIDNESRNLITVGFELVFPWMLDEAKSLGLDLPYDLPCLQNIYKFRAKKIKRIPIEVLHSVHTTMLHNLEGLQDVVKCRAVPAQYPIDLFERIWAVDTIQRLGIDHHFREEISDVLDYVYANAGKEGTSWSRVNPVPDIDDTCMALRLLRLHGYPISSDVLEYFKDDDGNMTCFPGQTHRGVSDMYNLYRYTQLAFPGEHILKDAKVFVEDYLNNCVKNNDVNDKWSIKKSLGKEVKRALDFAWRMSFNRLETREYIDQYGDRDVWISKIIYWMYNVNDPRYLELAKLDYNELQLQYEKEIDSILEWWNGCGFDDPSVSNDSPKETHFAISATLYEPNYAASRVAYTKCNCIENLIRDLFEYHESIDDLRIFCQAVKRWDKSMIRSLNPKIRAIFIGMYDTTNELTVQVSVAQGKDNHAYLHDLRAKQVDHYLKKREGREMPDVITLVDQIEQYKLDLGVAIRVSPSLFLLDEKLREFGLRSLDHNSKIQNNSSLFLTLFIDMQNNQDLVSKCAKENGISEKEALKYLTNMMEDEFDELVHEILKPGLVPRVCRRLMLEHARVTQYFNSEKMKDQYVRKYVIKGDAERMFTPI